MYSIPKQNKTIRVVSKHYLPSQMNFNAIGKCVMQAATLKIIFCLEESMKFLLLCISCLRKSPVIIKFSRPKDKKLSQSSGKVCSAHGSTSWFGNQSR